MNHARRIMKIDPNNNDAMSSVGDDLGNGYFKYKGTLSALTDVCTGGYLPIATVLLNMIQSMTSHLLLEMNMSMNISAAVETVFWEEMDVFMQLLITAVC